MQPGSYADGILGAVQPGSYADGILGAAMSNPYYSQAPAVAAMPASAKLAAAKAAAAAARKARGVHGLGLALADVPQWAWIAGGVAVLGGIMYFRKGRRR